MEVYVKFTDERVLKYLRDAERKIAEGTNFSIKRIGVLAYATALRNAPFRTGALRKSIVKGEIINNKEFKQVSITTQGDPDAKRAERFSRSHWLTFVNYLHNSSDVHYKNWKDKTPDFLTNEFIWSPVEKDFEVMIINTINNSLK